MPVVNPSHIQWSDATGMHTKNDIPIATIQSLLRSGAPVIANVMQGGHFVLGACLWLSLPKAKAKACRWHPYLCLAFGLFTLPFACPCPCLCPCFSPLPSAVTGWDSANPDTLMVNDPGFDRATYSYSGDVVGWRLFTMQPCAKGC